MIKTRNGLFSNAGFGGGIFNLNTGFGSYDDSTAAPVGDNMRQHQYRDVSNLNAPYDNMSLQGLGSISGEYGSLGFNMEEEHNFNMEAEHNSLWLAESPVTLNLQKSLNASLSKDGLSVVQEDGKLGPRTCGALQHYGRLGEATACNAHTAEFVAPTKATPSSSTTTTTAPTTDTTLARTGGGSVPSWVWAVLAGSGAVGVAIYLKKKKRGR